MYTVVVTAAGKAVSMEEVEPKPLCLETMWDCSKTMYGAYSNLVQKWSHWQICRLDRAS